MASLAPRALFQPAAGGQRLFIHHPPATSRCRGAVLYLHPLADEMNKARRMAALQCRALAANGYAALQIDLAGCGDSSGDFADATWAAWLDDSLLAARWLQAQHPGPLWLWGLRAGCLLATAASHQLPDLAGLLLWQPPANGQLLLQQFLRMRAAQGMQEGQNKGAMAQLRAELAAGQHVEVGGYALSPGLAEGLGAATLEPAAHCRQVGWFETTTREPVALLPAGAASIAAWQACGIDVHAQAVAGPAFWQTTEIEDAPALVDATLAYLATRVGA